MSNQKQPARATTSNSNSKESWLFVSLVAFSSALGLFLFFLNPSIVLLASQPNEVEWYAVFSNEIFQPNYAYIAESILLPLIAKIIGANASSQSYRILCAFITLLILPVLTIAVQQAFRNLAKTLVFLLLFAASFRYLWDYQLGFPDPLTILLITTAAVMHRPRAISFVFFLAAVSHFSQTLVAGATLVILLYANIEYPTDRKRHFQTIAGIVLGLIAGRCFLSLWYFVFEYKLTSRISYVFIEGLSVFIRRYESATLEFWLTPGIAFLALFLTMASCFIYSKHYKLAAGLVVALALAYCALFFTTDGLRVFAVVVSGVYAKALLLLIDVLYPYCDSRCVSLRRTVKQTLHKYKIDMFFLPLALVIAIGWCLLLYRAKSHGLFINNLTFMTLVIGKLRLFDLLLIITSFLIFLGIALSQWRHKKGVSFATKVLFIAPLIFIGIQFLRQRFLPNQPLSAVTLSVFIILLCGLSIYCATIKLTPRLQQLRLKFSRLLANV